MVRKTSVIPALFLLSLAANAGAVTSGEIYTSAGYQYGRYSSRIQFAPGSGVVSSFFLWKDGSEVEGTFWTELDFEKLEADCHVETNTIYGNPEGIDPEHVVPSDDFCGAFHIYTYEWTPDYIAWIIDGVEIRRETGDVAAAYAENTAAGMQLRFNVWPGDASFGGDFDPSILPVYQYIDWVEYSSYANGSFEVEWREDFAAQTVPAGWLTASWDSPKGLSTHAASNVGFLNGYAVLALTSDEAPGIQGAMPPTETPPAPTDSSPEPDTSVPEPDASAPEPDPSTPEPDPSTPEPDPSTPAPDTSAPEPVTSSSIDPSGSAAPQPPPTSPTDPSGAGGTGATPPVASDVPAASTTSPQVAPSAPAPGPSSTADAPNPIATATPQSDTQKDDGCSCQLPGAKHGTQGLTLLGLALLAGFVRRSMSSRR